MKSIILKSLLFSFLIVLVFTTSISIIGKPKNKNSDTSISKEVTVSFKEKQVKIYSYDKIENQHKKSISRLTYTKNIDEFNAKSMFNGKKLVYEGWVENNKMGIFSINSQNGKRKKIIYRDSNHNRFPSFNNDGKRIYFAALRENKSMLLWMDTQGLGGLHITPLASKGQITSLSVSSNNDIAFSQIIKGQLDLQIINLKNNYTIKIANGGDVCWSPDGEKIAFVAISENKNRDIFIINKDGSNLIQLTNFEEDVSHPSFSPSGEFICFDAKMTSGEKSKKNEKKSLENWDVFMMDINGVQLTQLTIDPSPDISPYWSQDGKIYFSSKRFGNYEIMVIGSTKKTRLNETK
ncbi:MAG: hypothetical protein COA79_01120 [Planctomycetota bacterium]|nr:MAG: hypothetical protein COA79_01120 [Planctomycetota bacterium]